MIGLALMVLIYSSIPFIGMISIVITQLVFQVPTIYYIK